ncbi:hypothetical protein NDU88_001550 [Pleurodeles waltl]|uniref:Uncharacterized protein n=1 Tax=Pleurodeles waltl TaxID=8319 RepID=A0AAV7UTN5_PLEWA|nr:hypothetical protein NDU88_001550 [Pleurodeles waltl]
MKRLRRAEYNNKCTGEGVPTVRPGSGTDGNKGIFAQQTLCKCTFISNRRVQAWELHVHTGGSADCKEGWRRLEQGHLHSAGSLGTLVSNPRTQACKHQ